MREKKIVSIEDRIPKLKQQRKKKANRRLIFYLSLFFILICVIIYLQSPLSHIKDIKVTGNHYLTEDEIVKKSELTKDTNIWKVSKKDVEKVISKDPVVESVQVKRQLPWTISIELDEYALVGYVKGDDGYDPLLENGTQVKKPVRYAQGDAPLLLHFTDEQMLQDMTSQLQKLPTNILRLISEIHWSPDQQSDHKIMLYMNDGFVVDGTIREFANKMQVYPSIVSQLDPETKGIIHIGVGAYFEQFHDETDPPEDSKDEQDRHEGEEVEEDSDEELTDEVE